MTPDEKQAHGEIDDCSGHNQALGADNRHGNIHRQQDTDNRTDGIHRIHTTYAGFTLIPLE